MNVLKFGGTSVASSENITKVIAIVASRKEKLIVVVSALGGITDLLLEAAQKTTQKDITYKQLFKEIEDRHLTCIKELIPVKEQSSILALVKTKLNQLETILDSAYALQETSARTLDIISSFGELLSSTIISHAMALKNFNVVLKDARELIKTDGNYGKATVNFETTNNLCEAYFLKTKYNVTIVPGFVASSSNGETTTLGRGGSDYTAAILASAINAEQLEIWTDVSGMFTANPKLVKQAYAIPNISYEEAMELSHFGAKVLYPPTIQPCVKKQIPIFIKNTFSPEATGTSISKNANGNGKPVRGITHIENIALLCRREG